MFNSISLNTGQIQLYHLNLDGGQCELYKPDPGLADYIDYYWLLSIQADTLELEVIPDLAVDLVLSPDIEAFAALYLPVNSKFHIPLNGPVKYAGICFKAAAVSEILEQEMAQLRKLAAGIETIESLAIEELASGILGLETIEACTGLFDHFWLDRLQTPVESAKLNPGMNRRNVLALMQESVGNASIETVCQTLDISERQFRRLSGDLFGLSPKKLQNILRLQATLDELLAHGYLPEQDFYYDDSHRIREIKRLTGMTPGEIRRMAEMYNRP